MRVTVKTKQERNSKESKYQKMFEKRLRKVLLKKYRGDEMKEGTIHETIGGFVDFDPVLDWEYQPLCGCEISGFEAINHNLKQNRLFERNGHLLYSTRLLRVTGASQVTDGYEMWVLENMKIVFTYYVEMKVSRGKKTETMTYRYALGKRFPDDMRVRLDPLLTAIDDQVYYARRPPAEYVSEKSFEEIFYGESI